MIFTDALHSQDADTSYSLPDNISEGPHIIETDSGKVSVMFVANEGAVEVRTSAFSKGDLITCALPDRSSSFSFRLRNVAEAGPAEFEMPEKILAISDIEGNFGVCFHPEIFRRY